MKLRLVNPGRKPDARKPFALMALLAALATSPRFVSAGATSPPQETITPDFQKVIPNVPGKSIVAVVVSYAPGGKGPPHRHARSAFVIGYVLSGSIRSQLDGGEVRVFHAGESWSEAPGTHHTISENASATEPAKLLALFVVDTDDKELTTPDQP